jgi:hypothetical protein
MCWITTYTASGKNYTSSKQLLKVGNVPSQTPALTISYATTNFQVNYNLPNTNGSSLTYFDVYGDAYKTTSMCKPDTEMRDLIIEEVILKTAL